MIVGQATVSFSDVVPGGTEDTQDIAITLDENFNINPDGTKKSTFFYKETAFVRITGSDLSKSYKLEYDKKDAGGVLVKKGLKHEISQVVLFAHADRANLSHTPLGTITHWEWLGKDVFGSPRFDEAEVILQNKITASMSIVYNIQKDVWGVSILNQDADETVVNVVVVQGDNIASTSITFEKNPADIDNDPETGTETGTGTGDIDDDPETGTGGSVLPEPYELRVVSGCGANDIIRDVNIVLNGKMYSLPNGVMDLGLLKKGDEIRVSATHPNYKSSPLIYISIP